MSFSEPFLISPGCQSPMEVADFLRCVIEQTGQLASSNRIASLGFEKLQGFQPSESVRKTIWQAAVARELLLWRTLKWDVSPPSWEPRVSEFRPFGDEYPSYGELVGSIAANVLIPVTRLNGVGLCSLWMFYRDAGEMPGRDLNDRRLFYEGIRSLPKRDRRCTRVYAVCTQDVGLPIREGSHNLGCQLLVDALGVGQDASPNRKLIRSLASEWLVTGDLAPDGKTVAWVSLDTKLKLDYEKGLRGRRMLVPGSNYEQLITRDREAVAYAVSVEDAKSVILGKGNLPSIPVVQEEPAPKVPGLVWGLVMLALVLSAGAFFYRNDLTGTPEPSHPGASSESLELSPLYPQGESAREWFDAVLQREKTEFGEVIQSLAANSWATNRPLYVGELTFRATAQLGEASYDLRSRLKNRISDDVRFLQVADEARADIVLAGSYSKNTQGYNVSLRMIDQESARESSKEVLIPYEAIEGVALQMAQLKDRYERVEVINALDLKEQQRMSKFSDHLGELLRRQFSLKCVPTHGYRYRLGERIQFQLRADRDCYVAILQGQAGDLSLNVVFGEARDQLFISEGAVFNVPGSEEDYFEVTEPIGEDLYYVVACTEEEPLRRLVRDLAGLSLEDAGPDSGEAMRGVIRRNQGTAKVLGPLWTWSEMRVMVEGK